MVFTYQNIERELRTNFARKYRRFAGFIDSGDLWDRVIKTINDTELMRNIKFCNDIMQIPPIKVFVMAQGPTLPKLSNSEKQSVGAVFGFIFKDVFGYTKQMSVSCVINTIKTATRFYNADEDIGVMEEE